MCISLCTTLPYTNTAQNSSDHLPLILRTVIISQLEGRDRGGIEGRKSGPSVNPKRVRNAKTQAHRHRGTQTDDQLSQRLLTKQNVNTDTDRCLQFAFDYMTWHPDKSITALVQHVNHWAVTNGEVVGLWLRSSTLKQQNSALILTKTYRRHST